MLLSSLGLSQSNTGEHSVTQIMAERSRKPIASVAACAAEPACAEAQEASVPPSTEVRVSTKDTLERKLASAHAAFRWLRADDPRARLLRMAVLRRDEVLLDALLARLSVPPPT